MKLLYLESARQGESSDIYFIPVASKLNEIGTLWGGVAPPGGTNTPLGAYILLWGHNGF